MKFYSYKKDEGSEIKLGVEVFWDQNSILPLEQFQIMEHDMTEFIKKYQESDLKKLKAQIEEKEKAKIEVLKKASIAACSPIPFPAQDVICLGINYEEHAKESARYKKEALEKERAFAVYFSKRVNEAVPDGGYIPAYADIIDSLDYESELAVIIGKNAKNIKEDEAYDYIFGYTIINDVSARNVQTRHKQWYFGKSFDGFTPMGPCIVTKDEFSYPPKVDIKSYVNGELRQNSNTEYLLTGISKIISELSQGMTLKAGTIISTGTPSGVGMGFVPPKFLVPGDEVTCEIEGIGRISNKVID